MFWVRRVFRPSDAAIERMREQAKRKEAADVYDFSRQIGHLLRRAYQRHVAVFQETMPDSRLTGAQFSVLCVLRDYGSVSMSEICRATAIDQATVRGIIERLKVRQLIATSADAVDRRKVIVALEPAGAALLEQVTPAAHRVSELTMAQLNGAERVALVYLLRKIAIEGAVTVVTEAVEVEANAGPVARQRDSADSVAHAVSE